MNGAIAILTLVLVLITGYYAWQNRNMVQEMRLARLATSHPRLAICFEPVGPLTVMIGVINLGPGAAVGIDVTLTFHPRSGSGFSLDSRRWRSELLSPGGQRDFFPPKSGEKLMSISELAKSVDRIVLAGTMSDVLGAKHKVNHEIRDLEEWDELLRNAHERYKEPALDLLVKETAKLVKAMEAAAKWTAFGGGLHVRTDADLAAQRADWSEAFEELHGAAAPPEPGGALMSAGSGHLDRAGWRAWVRTGAQGATRWLSRRT